MAQQVVTQLVIDASDAVDGGEQYSVAMSKAEAATNSFQASLDKMQTLFDRHGQEMAKISAANDNAASTFGRIGETMKTMASGAVSGLEKMFASVPPLKQLFDTTLSRVQTDMKEFGFAQPNDIQMLANLKSLASTSNEAGAAVGQLGSATLAAGQSAQQSSGLFSSFGGVVATVTVAAAAGLAAIVTGLNNSIKALSELGDRSQDVRLPVDLIRALEIQAGLAGVSQNELNSALDQFTKISKQSAKDAEDFYNALKKAGDGYVTAFKDAPSQQARLDVVSNALAKLTNETQRSQLEMRAFGTDNERLLQVLGQGAQGFSAAEAQMRLYGLAVDQNVAKASQQARSELSLLSHIFRDDLSSALNGLIPLLAKVEPYAKAIAIAVGQIAAAVELLTSTEDKSLSSNATLVQLSAAQGELSDLIKQRDELSYTGSTTTAFPEARSALRRALGISDESIADLDAGIEKVKARITLLQSSLDAARKREANPSSPPPFPAGYGSKSDGSSKSSIDSLEQRMQQQAALLNIEAEGAGKTTQAYQEMKAAHELAIAAIKDGVEPTDKQRAAVKAYADQIADATVRLNQFKALQSEQFKSATMFMSPSDQAAASAAHSIDPANWQAHMHDLAAETARFNSEIGQARDITLTFMQSFNNDIMNGTLNMNTLANAVKGLGAKLLDIAENQAINSLFGNAFGGGSGGGLLGLLFGGGGSSGVLPGGAALGTGGIGHAHGGAIVGSEATFSRYVHPAYFDDAPRFHAGGMIGPNEVPIVAQRGEGVFTAAQMRALAPAGSAPQINVFPVAGTTFDQKTDSDGTITLVGRMIDNKIDTFSKKALPSRVAAINADPRVR